MLHQPVQDDQSPFAANHGKSITKWRICNRFYVSFKSLHAHNINTSHKDSICQKCAYYLNRYVYSIIDENRNKCKKKKEETE